MTATTVSSTSCFYCLTCAFDAPFRFVVSTFLLRCSILCCTSSFFVVLMFFRFSTVCFSICVFRLSISTRDFRPSISTFARRYGEHGEQQLNYITYS